MWPWKEDEIAKLRRKLEWESQDVHTGLCGKNKCFFLSKYIHEQKEYRFFFLSLQNPPSCFLSTKDKGSTSINCERNKEISRILAAMGKLQMKSDAIFVFFFIMKNTLPDMGTLPPVGLALRIQFVPKHCHRKVRSQGIWFLGSPAK